MTYAMAGISDSATVYKGKMVLLAGGISPFHSLGFKYTHGNIANA
ncbi:hypothetical protein [Chromobacterium paludis]|nr:hypothetical protein [Chromobacterium paludis]